MGNCKFTILIDGHYQEFNSEQELDTFLRTNKQSLVTSLLSNKVVFSTDKSKQEKSVDMIEAMSSKLTMDPVEHRYYLNGGEEMQSVTKFITTARIKGALREYRLVNEFNLKNVMEVKTQELLSERDLEGNAKYTTEQADAIVEDLKNKWEIQSLVGTSWHNVAQAFFQGEINSPADVKRFLPDGADLSNYMYGYYFNELTKLKTKLIKKHGDDATFIAEAPIYDNQTDYKIAGTVDLIVIDNKGDAHIYDYKTSTKSDETWNTSKIKTIQYQLSFYRQILRRAGLNVKSVQYLPVQLNEVDYENKLIRDFKVGQLVPIHISDGEEVALRVANFLPYTTLRNLEDVSSNNNIHEFMEKAFNYQQKNIKRGSKSVDELYTQVLTQKSNDGKSYVLYNTFNTNIRKYIPVGTSEANIKLEIEKYLTELDAYNEKLPIEFHDFVRYAKNAKASGMSVEMEKRWNNNADTLKKLKTLLFKYIEDSAWHPLESDLMYDLGVVAFENEFTHEVDFISLTANKLTDAIKLQKGSTLLGNAMSDNRAAALGARENLTVGDVELLKIYALVKNNEETFKDKKIGKMFAVNMQNNKVIPAIATQTFDALELQWKLLLKHTPEFKLKGLDWEITGVDSYDALTGYIADLFEDDTFYLPNSSAEIKRRALELKGLEAMGNAEKIRALGDLWNAIMKSIGDDLKGIKDERRDISQLLTLISEAILQLDNRVITVEEDMKRWGNFIGENMNLSTPERVRKSLARHAVNLVREALNNAGHLFNEHVEDFRSLHAKYYASKGASAFQIKSIGYNQALFTDLLEKPVNGKSSFRFKNTETDTTLTAAQKAYINGFLKPINEARRKKLIERGDPINLQAFEEVEKWNVPLMKTSMFSAFLGKNTKEFFNDYFREMMNPNNIYDNDDVSKRKLAHHREMFNQFDWMDIDYDKRDEELNNSPSTAFEVDLEAVLAMYLMADSKQQEFNKILPKLNALKTLTVLADRNYFTDNEVTADFIDNFVGTTLFGKSLVAGESAKTATIVKAAVDLTSIAMLGFSPISGLTEWMTGIWSTATRNIANVNQDWIFGTKELAKAIPLVYIDSSVNAKMSIENINFCDSINEMFQVSEMDIRQLVNEVQSTNTGIKNFKGKYMYGMNALPNYLHRMIMFNAQMIKDGILKPNAFGKISEDSSIKMVNGQLRYDSTKDDRFALYLRYQTMPENKQTTEWKEARAAYNTLVENLSQEPGGLKADGTPARPYDNRERNSLKSYADQVFGNYDQDSKAHFSKTAFGQIFTQFKNWAYSKKHRWFSETDNEGRQGRYVTEMVDGQPVKIWKGKVMEGIYQSFMATVHDLRDNKMDIIKTWQDMTPVAKENFAWMISDLLGFAILSMLASLWGSSLAKDDPMQTFVRPLRNSANDLYIGSTVSAFAGTKNPIAIFGWSANVLNDTWGALTGDGKSLSHLPDNVGVLRTLGPLFSSED